MSTIWIPPPPEPPQPPDPDAEGEFDPGEHTVDEVKEYVEAHPDEVDDVLSAEETGKARVTLITWLEEQAAPSEDSSEEST